MSGGQLQRLILSRTFFKNPKVVFFDEATSALDNYTELKIISNLETFL